MNIFKKITILSLLFFVAQSTFGAQISVVTEKQTFAQNEEFLVSVFLNTEGETINAYEGRILYSADLLLGKEIRDGNSLINFWIERPNFKQLTTGDKQGTIIFSGITPGGYSGTNGLLFSAVFQTMKSGADFIQTDGLRLLLNDGKGTVAKVSALPYSLTVTTDFATSSPSIEPIIDTESPENFVPIISRDVNVFEGKYFLVFATQDKGSGIDRYEVSEDNGASFIPSLSPYLLKNQSLDTKIIVKAFDKKGNEKIAEVEMGHPSKWQIFALIIILLLLISSVIFIYRKKHANKIT